MRNRLLFDAYKAFHVEALANIGCLKEVVPGFSVPEETWEHVGSNDYRKTSYRREVWGRGLGEIGAPLCDSQSYLHLIVTMESIPEVSRHLGQLVGTAMGSTTITQSWLAVSTVRQALIRNDANFDETRFLSYYLEVEQALYAEHITQTRYIAIKGVSLEIDEVNLGEGVTLRRLDPQAVAELLNKGLQLQYGSWGDRFGLIKDPANLVFERKLGLPKVLGGNVAPDEIAKAIKRVLSVDVESLFVAVCRLYRNCAVDLSNDVSSSAPEFFSVGHVGYRANPNSVFIANLHLNITESQELISLWELVRGLPAESRFLLRAIERFSAAMTRPLIDDRVIDLAIAGEGLFLSGEGNKSELKYRLCHRAAKYLGTSSEDAKLVYERFSEFYDLRSKVVHGNYDLHRDEGALPAQTQLIEAVASDIRSAIRLGVAGVANRAKKKQLVDDWTALLFKAF